MEKQCSRCKKLKFISEFYSDKRAKDKLRSDCKQCVGLSVKKWCRKNTEKVKSYQRKWTTSHPEKVKISRKKWEISNPEKNKISKRKWRKFHPDQYKEWRKKNPKKISIINKNQRNKRRGAIGSHTLEQWEELKKKHSYCCAMCGRQEPFTDLWYKFLTEDHIIPISKGGSSFIENIQPLCIICNSKKGDK